MKNLSSEAYVQHAARRLFYAYYKFLKSLSENFHFTHLQLSETVSCETNPSIDSSSQTVDTKLIHHNLIGEGWSIS
jgi:hypothetical protein